LAARASPQLTHGGSARSGRRSRSQRPLNPYLEEHYGRSGPAGDPRVDLAVLPHP
jgi:hypothetical protein